MAAITSLTLRSPVILCPSSATNPRFNGINRNSAVNNLFSLVKPYPCLSIRNPKSIRITASASSPSPSTTPITPVEKFTAQSSTLTGPTRSLATLAALAIVVVRVLSQKLSLAVQSSTPVITDALRTSGPVFFAAMRNVRTSRLNTPLAVVAKGVKKWIDIYSGVLLIRVLLSWFPNVPWERQPLSAIRDLCDPYLSIFRGILPPVFGTLDVSPLLAFTVLGLLGGVTEGGLS